MPHSKTFGTAIDYRADAGPEMGYRACDGAATSSCAHAVAAMGCRASVSWTFAVEIAGNNKYQRA
jgi:hypothetical protein